MKTISERLEFLREELGHYKACADVSSFYSSRIPQLEAEIKALERENLEDLNKLTVDDCLLLMTLIEEKANSQVRYDRGLERLHTKLGTIARAMKKKEIDQQR